MRHIIALFFKQQKKPSSFEAALMRIFGGLFQIRTGVNGFADRCLTSRPRDLVFLRVQRYDFFADWQSFARAFCQFIFPNADYQPIRTPFGQKIKRRFILPKRHFIFSKHRFGQSETPFC